MLRRDFRHMLRYPMMAISGVATSTFFLLLFVYVFGGTMGAAKGGATYIDYVVPGILVMAVGSGSAATAINVNADMAEGIIDTLRGLLMGTPIGNSAVLAVAWCAGITLVGYLWARAAYNRDPAR